MPLVKKEKVIEPALTAALQSAGAEGLSMGQLVAVARGTPFKSYWGTYSALRRMFAEGKVARLYEYEAVGRNRFGKRVYRYFLTMYANPGIPGMEMPPAPTAVAGVPDWNRWTPPW